LGGVYFVSAPSADASNMGFKLERAFEVHDGLRNFYFVSFPLFNGLSDTADSGNSSDPCGGPPDGDINADDAICDLWTDRDSSMGGSGFTIQKFDTSTCLYVARTGVKVSPTNFFFTGGFTAPIDSGVNREIGYLCNVARGPADPPIENRAVIVGSHDPSFAGHPVDTAGGCLQDIINVPYHTMYRQANEILCGLETVDWVDDDGDGAPDTCPNGIYDINSGPGQGATAQTFDNDPASPTANLYVARTVVNLGTSLRFLGSNFDLRPGEGYPINMAAGTSSVFLSPHF
jgi:hypothetical protein